MPQRAYHLTRLIRGDRRGRQLVQLGQARQRVWYLWVPGLTVTILMALGTAAFVYPGFKWPPVTLSSGMLAVLPQLSLGLLSLALLESFYIFAKIHEARELRGYILAISEEAAFLNADFPQDGLTSVLDRRALPDLLRRETTWVDRYRIPLCLVLLDIRDFGKINERQGNMAGDLVLKEFAGAIQATIRQTDSVLRYAGDEFLCLLPRTDPPGGAAFKRRVMNACQRSARLRELVVDSGIAVYEAGTDVNAMLARTESELTSQKESTALPAVPVPQADVQSS